MANISKNIKKKTSFFLYEKEKEQEKNDELREWI